MFLPIQRAYYSLSAKWSETPEIFVWTAPPPSYSLDTTSPVAALTRGGPPRKIVPFPFTIIF